MNEHDLGRLESVQQQSLDVLQSVFADDFSHAVLLDFPTHRNAGDSLIWSGEIAYLERLGISVKYTSDVDRFNPQLYDEAREGGVVLFHGGGNLGDLWPRYQAFRERVVERSPGVRIVVLSQSLLFKDPAAAARANRVFSAQGQVTVLLRDFESIERAHSALPDVDVRFCPDMAFGNYPFERPRPATHDFVVTVRGDHERLDDSDVVLPDAYGPIDWGSGMSRWDTAKYWAARAPGLAYRRVPAFLRPTFERSTQRGSERIYKINMDSAIRILSKGRVVVTDRLHAHVFAILLGIPHVVQDNVYGKIGSVFEAYSGGFSTAHLTNSAGKAQEIAGDLLSELSR